MKRIMILVEGQSEETFVNKVLSPYFYPKNIFLETTIICTKKVKGQRSFRGGLNDYDQVKRDINLLKKSSHFDYITTFFDYYGLPSNFPGLSKVGEIYDIFEKVKYLEKEFYDDISSEKFIPFIMLHEFETMIFCDPLSLNGFFPERKLSRLNQITENHLSPEHINNSPQTAPSKRILNELQSYQKPFHGPIAIEIIGLEKIKDMCQHFDEWIAMLETSS
ncbi:MULTISPECIES: DUF4276 family protein [unclassified Exiguobacterium]|uniref:DUF4276 family protein n=1 Tax=unclassified Exiguobacterium TaxID=2644629 RepID=UPI001BE64B7C|nr:MULTISPECIES: DUF4276 family protein [unclassified Exiguobacterium]